MDRITAACVIGCLLFPAICRSQTIATVRTVTAQAKSISETVAGYGVLQPSPAGDIKISAVSPMRIDSILVGPGDCVRKGQLLVKLQRDPSIDVGVEKARIALKRSEADRDRAKNLYEKGVYPRVSFEQAETDHNLAKAEFDMKSAALRYAVRNSEIRSPIDGFASSVDGAVGQIADPSQVIVRVVNTEVMLAQLGVESEDIDKVKPRQKVDVTVPNLADTTAFSGVVRRANKEIDPTSQLIRVWVEIDNPGDLLEPGMFAVGRIVVRTESDAPVVPRSAVLADESGTYVFVVENDVTRKVYVKTGIQTDEEVQITEGIEEGQRVVYEGNYELDDGMRVNITE
jgi:membrane fusion protein, multidrug efflux system